jgi:hypothetical protein
MGIRKGSVYGTGRDTGASRVYIVVLDPAPWFGLNTRLRPLGRSMASTPPRSGGRPLLGAGFTSAGRPLALPDRPRSVETNESRVTSRGRAASAGRSRVLASSLSSLITLRIDETCTRVCSHEPARTYSHLCTSCRQAAHAARDWPGYLALICRARSSHSAQGAELR